MGTVDEVHAVLESFVDDLHANVDTHRLEELLQGDDTLKSADTVSKPESWTRKHLIRKLLDAVGLEWEPEIHGKGEGYPDFGITNVDVLVIGEDKSINKIEEASEEVKDYLNNRAASRDAEYGIATDGIEWFVYRIELGGDYLDYDEVAQIDFRQDLLQIARDKGYISKAEVVETEVKDKVNEFYTTFTRDEFNTLLTQEAPKQIRAQKKAGIEEFYDLYVELLFGEGKRDYEYDTTLLDDIQAPDGVSETAKRKFAIKLVNRLLFVKFLEDRDVLPENFLGRRVTNFQRACDEVEAFGGGLYKTQLEPLFFRLFNTPRDERISKHRGSWFDKVPYLNGSLFAPDEKEREYDVDDRMLVTVVQDLVEGHKLEEESNGDGSLDPSVLGNVFEMTINHISGETDAQQAEGAYYTPGDVIQLITRHSVDPKIYEILVDVYTDRLSTNSDLGEDDARSMVSSYDLGEMLKKIENHEGYFSDPDAIQEAYDELGSLKVVDPACGSGHFLTAVLDDIHRVRMSLLRGLKKDVDTQDVYEAKKEMLLNAIYGVDINPIAIEIAKLRVWLKMVEKGWEHDFGELPNIDVNIVDGNSLVGLPAKSGGQSLLRGFDIDLDQIEQVRDKYKAGEIDRRALAERIEELRPELREIYADNLNHYFEDRTETVDELEALIDAVDNLYPVVRAVRVRRQDGSEFSEADEEKLEEAGFRTYKKSARLEGEEIDRKTDVLRSLLGDEFVLELERRPTTVDVSRLEEISDLSHEPFHWVVEFPEAATGDGNGYSVEFDIVVGNPPYGNVITELEDRFTSGYKTGKVNDIAAQFLERQLQLMNKGGYLGNVITLRLIYDGKAHLARDILKQQLTNTQIACFGWRPSYIFAGSEALAAVITGRRASEEHSDIQTSRFILFSDDDRKTRLENIEYCTVNDLVLGETIGGGSLGESSDKAMPKVGNKTAKAVLEKLREVSDTTIRDKERDDETDHIVWRKEGARYWINPLLESFWSEEERSRETKPMYFASELERYTVFLLLQSSMFYHHWMTYGDQQHVSWKLVRSFPFPDLEEVEEHEAEIKRLAEELWAGMEKRFHPDVGVKGEIQGVAELKPLIDEIDDLLGPMFGLSEEEISYVKQLDTEYGRSAVSQGQEQLEVSDVEAK